MDHFGAPGRPQDMRDVARVTAADALGVQGVIGDKPAPDLGSPLISDGDTIAPREHAHNTAIPVNKPAASIKGHGRAAPRPSSPTNRITRRRNSDTLPVAAIPSRASWAFTRSGRSAA